MTNLVSFQDSLRLALVEEMTADESVFCLGVGVADHKRIFGTLACINAALGKLPGSILLNPLPPKNMAVTIGDDDAHISAIAV